jgi:hypothetical protein
MGGSPENRGRVKHFHGRWCAPAHGLLLGKELPDQFTAALHPDFLKDRLEVVLHRMGRDVEGIRHLGRRPPTQHTLGSPYFFGQGIR